MGAQRNKPLCKSELGVSKGHPKEGKFLLCGQLQCKRLHVFEVEICCPLEAHFTGGRDRSELEFIELLSLKLLENFFS